MNIPLAQNVAAVEKKVPLRQRQEQQERWWRRQHVAASSSICPVSTDWEIAVPGTEAAAPSHPVQHKNKKSPGQ